MPTIADPFAKAPRSLICAVDATTLRVLLMLATYADFKSGRDAWPSVPNMAAALGVNDRTVQRALKIGVAKGLIKPRIRFRDDGGQTSTGYDCLWLATLQPVEGVTQVSPGGSQESHREGDSVGTQSESDDRKPNDRKNTHPPVGGTDVFESDVTSAAWKRARAEAQNIADFWNEHAGVKPYTLPAKHVPWQLAGAFKRWTGAEVGKIIETVRDSDYCNGSRKHTANLLWAMTPEFGDKLLAGQFTDD